MPAGLDRLDYDLLRIEANGSLVIPESYAGRKLTVRANRFEAFGGTRLYQVFSNRARTGGTGGPGLQPDYGQTGGEGGSGGRGIAGTDTVELTLELGIAKLGDFTLLLRSQAGGHGGRGGKGGLGGGSRCGLSKGNGDPGGSGGPGGAGGDGAAPGNIRPLTLRWWPVGSHIPHFRSGQPVQLDVILQSGQGGWGGPQGVPGNGHGGKGCGCAFGKCTWDMPSGSAGTVFGAPGKPYPETGALAQPRFEALEFAQ